VIPVIALRLWQLSPSADPNPDHPRIYAYILTEGAMELAFILASITCLKPVMKPFHSGYVVSTAPQSGYTSAAKVSHRDAYMELSAAKSSVHSRGDKDGGVAVVKRDRDSRGDGMNHGHRRKLSAPVARADHADHEAVVSSATESQRQMDEHDMSISKTQAWTI
ncbi:hypothetical protein LTR53_019262, partial [Teratosphaeriaceae sp. CCFEE 6253]